MKEYLLDRITHTPRKQVLLVKNMSVGRLLPLVASGKLTTTTSYSDIANADAISLLINTAANVIYHDPFVLTLLLPDGTQLATQPYPQSDRRIVRHRADNLSLR